MRRKLLTILTLVICATISFSSISCASVGIRNPEKIKEVLVQSSTVEIIEMGEFPQSRSNDEKYVEFDGFRYKIEPLKWRVLEKDGDTALLVCDIAIAGFNYDSNSNNYQSSEIRNWLMNEFYKNAFSEEEKEKIICIEVDNSVASTGVEENNFACSNTEDKIFLLSLQEVLSDKYFATASSRKFGASDYAKAMGVKTHFGNCWWWLRSPNGNYVKYANLVGVDGENGWYFVNECGGIVPAMRVKL